MYVLTHDIHEPAFNLACEEYFLTGSSREIFILWRNRPSVIVGRNQDTLSEIDPDYTEREGIVVMRRITGGGAVFHDLGNINYSFIAAHDGPIDFARFCEPMVRMLRGVGLDAAMTGRNDIQIRDRKVSGTAQTVKNGRVLHHGTLLYSADLTRLSLALRVNRSKYSGRAVKSVGSRVCNIADHLTDAPDVAVFLRRLYDAVLADPPGNEAYALTDADLKAIGAIRSEKYDRAEWTFGRSGTYNFSGEVRCPAGGLQARMSLEDGIIRSVSFSGDFFGQEDPALLAALLTGLPHRPDALREVLTDETIARFFAGFAWEHLRTALF